MFVTKYRKNRSTKRKSFGTTIAELPAGLWMIFVGFGMPLLCLTLTVIRYGLFMEAARQAADVAAQAQAYVNTNDVQTSRTITGAVNLAQDKAMAVAATFSGLTINPDDVKCWIVITPLVNTGGGGSTVVGPNTPLSTPPDPTENLYQLRVDITGQIQPMVSMNIDYFAGIPGLNSPMPVKSSMTRVFENPQGLYQQSQNNGNGNNGNHGNGNNGNGNNGNGNNGNGNNGNGNNGNNGGGSDLNAGSNGVGGVGGAY